MFKRPDAKLENRTEAFTSLYNRCFDSVYGYVFARTSNAAIAEDIVQETFAAAWAAMGGFEGRSRDSTWLTAIAGRKVADHYRRAMRRERRETADAAVLDTMPSPHETAEMAIGAEMSGCVAGALCALSPAYRYALALKHLDGCNVKEIAAALHKTPKAVDGILQRAKAAFIRKYNQLSGEDGNG